MVRKPCINVSDSIPVICLPVLTSRRFGAITWMCICYTHMYVNCVVWYQAEYLIDDDHSRFMKAMEAQGIPRETLPYKAPFQPFGSWFALISTGIITIFKGQLQLNNLNIWLD